MAIEPKRGSESYLHACLADGARPFLYRGRVRALLGLPQAGGVAMNFPSRLPMADFSYVIPKFAGEFELPDDVFPYFEGRKTAASETGNVKARNAPSSNSDATLDRHPAAPGLHRRDTSAADSLGRKDSAAPSERRESAHIVSLPGVSTRSFGETVVANPLHGMETGMGAAARVQASPVGSMDTHRNAPVAKSLNLTRSDKKPGPVEPVFPSVQVEPVLPSVKHAASIAPEKRAEFALTADSQSQRWQDVALEPSPRERNLSRPAFQPHTTGGSLETELPARVMPQLSRLSSSQASQRAVSRDTPSGEEPPKPWEQRDFPVRRPTNPEAKNAKKILDPHRKSPWEQVRPASPVAAPPQLVIFQQAAERSVLPAFWERRYLNRVRARVRQ